MTVQFFTMSGQPLVGASATAPGTSVGEFLDQLKEGKLLEEEAYGVLIDGTRAALSDTIPADGDVMVLSNVELPPKPPAPSSPNRPDTDEGPGATPPAEPMDLTMIPAPIAADVVEFVQMHRMSLDLPPAEEDPLPVNTHDLLSAVHTMGNALLTLIEPLCQKELMAKGEGGGDTDGADKPADGGDLDAAVTDENIEDMVNTLVAPDTISQLVEIGFSQRAAQRAMLQSGMNHDGALNMLLEMGPLLDAPWTVSEVQQHVGARTKDPNVTQLIDMGFPEAAAKRALKVCDNNFADACALLLGDGAPRGRMTAIKQEEWCEKVEAMINDGTLVASAVKEVVTKLKASPNAVTEVWCTPHLRAVFEELCKYNFQSRLT